MKRNSGYSAATGPNWRTVSPPMVPLVPEIDNVLDVGSATKRFKTVYTVKLQADSVATNTTTLVGKGISENSFVAFGDPALVPANCIVIGNLNTAAIRAATLSACSLGTPGKPFVDINLTGSVRGLNNSRPADDIVSTSSAGVVGNLPTFSASKVVVDSNVALASLATNAAVAAVYLPKAGGVMTGSIAMGTNSVTGTGANSSGSLAASLTTVSSSPSTGAIVSAGGLGVASKIFTGSNAVHGPVQAMAVETCLTLRGANASTLAGPHLTVYSATDQYPIFQQLNYTHNLIILNFDCYDDGVSNKSSHVGSNYQIAKFNNRLNFQCASGVAPGAVLSTLTTAGYIDTGGILQWNRAIKTADTTNATSVTTGALVSAGGLGVADRAYIGGMFHALGDVSLGSATASLGSGVKVIGISNCTTAPTTTPTGGGVLFVEGGALKFKGGVSGTVTTVAVA